MFSPKLTTKLKKIDYCPRSSKDLAQKGVYKSEFKESWSIRNFDEEHFAAVKNTTGRKYREIGEKSSIPIRILNNIPFENPDSHIHNHPADLIKANLRHRIFSINDLKSFIFGSHEKELVSTFDTFFILRKKRISHFTKAVSKKSDSAPPLESGKLTRIQNNLGHLQEISNKEINTLIEKLLKTELSLKRALTKFEVKLFKQIEKIGIKKADVSNQEKLLEIYNNEPEKIQKLIRVKNKNAKKEEQIWETHIQNFSESINAQYNKYSWEELLPNLFKSRGKLRNN